MRTSKEWVAGYPKLVAEWHPTKNLDLYPYEVRRGSGLRIWWRCSKAPRHEWTARPNDRTGRSFGCPFCAGLRASPTNSVAAVAPELAKQWHPTKNAPLRPRDVVARSGKEVWWKCAKGRDHEWTARPVDRVTRGFGCPFCSGQRVSVTNSLARIAPELAAQWHPSRNRGLTPADVTAHSKRKVWWQCGDERDHVWQTHPGARMRSRGCPFCSGRRLSKRASLAVEAPTVARELHPSKNSGLRASEISAGTPRRLWWRCSRKRAHEWQASVSNRVRLGNGCPFCAGKRVAPETSLAGVAPKIARMWDRERNELSPDRISARDHRRRIWWRCPAGDDHRFTQVVARMVDGAQCPFCTGRRPSRKTALSAARPDLARQWHPTCNESLRPADLSIRSSKRVWWRCKRGSDHEWRAPVAVRARGVGCPFCAGRAVSVTNSLATRAPGVARRWHPTRNKKKPTEVVPGSTYRAWWICDEDRTHVWCSQVRHLAVVGTGCPTCARARMRGRPRRRVA